MTRSPVNRERAFNWVRGVNANTVNLQADIGQLHTGTDFNFGFDFDTEKQMKY